MEMHWVDTAIGVTTDHSAPTNSTSISTEK